MSRLAVLGVLALLAAPLPAAQTAAAPRTPPGPTTQHVGSLVLRRCGDIDAFCGEVERALDPAGAVPGKLAIHFEFYPRRGRIGLGTLVATEGGPGYPATGSRDDYLALFDPLRDSHDVLIMDNRGTGQSGAVDCAALQASSRWTSAGVGACGDTLGPRAPLYSTAYAADDLAAILAALGIAKIDLYGDSYGTYFEQVFALRHPALLHSLVLDGAYPLDGPDYAWYPNYAPAMRDKFNLACRRSPACAVLPGTSLDHIAAALTLLRGDARSVEARDADGRLESFRADPAALATVMFAAAPALASVRELDAAARAYAGGDSAPLLRLMAETRSAVDSRDPAANPQKWSAGLAAAVMCHDPPQIDDMRLAPEQRAAEHERIIAARARTHPDTYAPFTIAEYRGLPLDYGFIDLCVAWPVAAEAHPAGQVAAPEARYPNIPALVISGELDDITTVADGAAVAAEFPRGRQLVIANSFHVNALPRARSACAAKLVRQFFKTGEAGDTHCTGEVPPLRLVAQFARSAGDLAPVMPAPGNQVGVPGLKVANAVLQTLADALVRVDESTSGSASGLRGGRLRVLQHGPKRRVSLYDLRWTDDVAVSGSLDLPRGRNRLVIANLTVAGRDGLHGEMRVTWLDGDTGSQAQLRGSVNGEALVARAPAP
jgi:pimeloyl-ACP methyl ester carboxylesterase